MKIYLNRLLVGKHLRRSSAVGFWLMLLGYPVYSTVC